MSECCCRKCWLGGAHCHFPTVVGYLLILFKSSNACVSSIQFTRASHPLLFMLPWTPNACSDVSKCQISITMTFTVHLVYVFPQFNSPQASHLLLFMLPWTPNACSDVSKCQFSINMTFKCT